MLLIHDGKVQQEPTLRRPSSVAGVCSPWRRSETKQLPAAGQITSSPQRPPFIFGILRLVHLHKSLYMNSLGMYMNEFSWNRACSLLELQSNCPGVTFNLRGMTAFRFYKHTAPLGQGEWRPFVSTNTSTCNLQLSTCNLQPVTCDLLGADVVLDLVVSPLAKAVDNDDVLRALERPVFIAVFNYLAGKARPNSWQQRQVLGARGIQINARSIAIRRRTALMISVCNAGTIGRSSCALILAERPVTGARR